jgi:hypothetical protein
MCASPWTISVRTAFASILMFTALSSRAPERMSRDRPTRDGRQQDRLVSAFGHTVSADPWRQLFDCVEDDRDGDPGTFQEHVTANGDRVALQDGPWIYLSGVSGSSRGDVPFLDKVNLDNGAKVRLFQSKEGSLETFVTFVGSARAQIVIGHEMRAVRKEQKHYHFDWSLVPAEAARFENLVASHLLKWVHFEQDTKGRDLELRYFRDTDGREVDFVVTEGKQLILMVEAKWNDSEIDRGLRYLKERFKTADAWQVSAIGGKDYVSPEGIRVAPSIELLKTLV